MNRRRDGSQQGQVLIIMAMGLFLVMLGSAALALDWGNGLLERRRLQNAADAAALAAATELARGGTEASAVSAAQAVVSSNTGGAVALPYPGTGSGSALQQGVEVIGDSEVRVALVRQVNTLFAPVLGVNNLTVGVRSRAAVGPYGVLPITVKRFSAGDSAFPLGTNGNPEQVMDYLMPAQDASGQPNYISAWPSPLSASASPSAAFSPPDAYDPRVSGPVMPLVGRRALANVANGNDFHFFVAPDIRGITQLVPDFYNGLTLDSSDPNSAQLVKNITTGYILDRGYPGPNPLVGEQLGVFSGAPTDHAVDAMRKVYRRGDVVTAMVYDGTVYRKPAFDLQLDAYVKSSPNIGPSNPPITFQVTLVPRNNFSSSGVEFSAIGLEGWADWRFESNAQNTVYTTPVGAGGVTVNFSVSSSSVVQGARTALIKVYDPTSSNMKTICATIVVGGIPAFSLSSAEGYKVVEQGSATRFDLDLTGWNGYPTTDVVIDSVQWFTSGAVTSPTTAPSGVTVTLPATARVRDSHTTWVRASIDVATGADVGQWLMKVRVRDPNDATRNQELYLTLQVIPANSNPTLGLTTSFVKVLGYANFVITYADNTATPNPNLDGNTVYAYAVSRLTASPADLDMGMLARLVPWQ